MEPKIHKCSEALLDNIRLQTENSESVNMKEQVKHNVHTYYTVSWCSYVCGTHQPHNIMVFIRMWYTPTIKYREH